MSSQWLTTLEQTIPGLIREWTQTYMEQTAENVTKVVRTLTHSTADDASRYIGLLHASYAAGKNKTTPPCSIMTNTSIHEAEIVAVIGLRQTLDLLARFDLSYKRPLAELAEKLQAIDDAGKHPRTLVPLTLVQRAMIKSLIGEWKAYCFILHKHNMAASLVHPEIPKLMSTISLSCLCSTDNELWRRVPQEVFQSSSARYNWPCLGITTTSHGYTGDMHVRTIQEWEWQRTMLTEKVAGEMTRKFLSLTERIAFECRGGGCPTTSPARTWLWHQAWQDAQALASEVAQCETFAQVERSLPAIAPATSVDSRLRTLFRQPLDAGLEDRLQKWATALDSDLSFWVSELTKGDDDKQQQQQQQQREPDALDIPLFATFEGCGVDEWKTQSAALEKEHQQLIERLSQIETQVYLATAIPHWLKHQRAVRANLARWHDKSPATEEWLGFLDKMEELIDPADIPQQSAELQRELHKLLTVDRKRLYEQRLAFVQDQLALTLYSVLRGKSDKMVPAGVLDHPDSCPRDKFEQLIQCVQSRLHQRCAAYAEGERLHHDSCLAHQRSEAIFCGGGRNYKEKIAAVFETTCRREHGSKASHKRRRREEEEEEEEADRPIFFLHECGDGKDASILTSRLLIGSSTIRSLFAEEPIMQDQKLQPLMDTKYVLEQVRVRPQTAAGFASVLLTVRQGVHSLAGKVRLIDDAQWTLPAYVQQALDDAMQINFDQPWTLQELFHWALQLTVAFAWFERL